MSCLLLDSCNTGKKWTENSRYLLNGNPLKPGNVHILCWFTSTCTCKAKVECRFSRTLYCFLYPYIALELHGVLQQANLAVFEQRGVWISTKAGPHINLDNHSYSHQHPTCIPLVSSPHLNVKASGPCRYNRTCKFPTERGHNPTICLPKC